MRPARTGIPRAAAVVAGRAGRGGGGRGRPRPAGARRRGARRVVASAWRWPPTWWAGPCCAGPAARWWWRHPHVRHGARPAGGGAGDVRVAATTWRPSSSWSSAPGPPGVLGALALAAELERARRRVDAMTARERAPGAEPPRAGGLGQPRPAHAAGGDPGHGRGAGRRRRRRPGRRRAATTTSSSTESERLARLVDDLFELSRIQADALPLTLERVPLGDLVSDAVASAARGGRGQGRPLAAGSTRRRGAARGDRVAARAGPGRAQPARQRHPPHARRAARSRSTCAAATAWPRCRSPTAAAASPTDDLDRVFDLAYRGDGARTPGAAAAPGSGSPSPGGWWRPTDGDIAVRNEPGGCRFTVRLPRA